MRGLKSLSVRLERQTASALILLAKIEAHTAVVAVTYPNSASHQTRTGREMNGSLIALEFAVPEAAKVFVERLRHFDALDWFGAADNTVCIPSRSSHRALEPLGLGLLDTIVRLSIGLEDVTDSWRVLETALNAAFEVTPEPEPLEPDEPETSAHPPLPALEDPTLGMENEVLQRFVQLRQWRDQSASSQNISRFLVVSNSILAQIARLRPTSLETLGAIKGIGAKKLERYGKNILEVLTEPVLPWLAQLPKLEASSPTREKPNAVPPPPVFDPKRKRRRKKKVK